ncbi:MAG: hypothetical protein EXR98_03835 [Gemmataceae bacterium]|nr:hypothetical protein [Gemmataceae bacterium]
MQRKGLATDIYESACWHFPMNTCALLMLPVFAVSLGCSDGKTDRPPINHVAFSPDGKWLVGAGGTVKPNGGEGIAKVWETSTWKLHDTWGEGFTDRVEQVHFASNEMVATWSNEMEHNPRGGSPQRGIMLRRWNIPEKKELPKLHLSELRTWAGSTAYYPAGNLVASSSKDADKIGAIFTVPKLEETVTLKEDQARGASFRGFSPDGKRILVAIGSAESPEVRVFDTSNGQRLAAHKLDASNSKVNPTHVRSAEFSPNGKMIVIGTINPIKIYVLTADLSATLLTLELGLFPDCLKFTPDNEMVAIKNGRNSIEMYSIKTKEAVKTFDGNPEGANGWCFSPDGAWIAIGSGGHPDDKGKTSPGKVRVFEVKTGKLVAELE